MFDAVLNKSNVPKTRFGLGTVLSILVHVGLLGLVVWLSSRPTHINEPDPEVTFFAALPVAPPPPPPPPPKKKVQKKVEVKPKPDAIIQPKEIPIEKPPEKEPEPEKSAGPDEGPDEGVEGGVEGGVAGGVIGGSIGGGTDVVAFGEGMTRPVYDVRELTAKMVTREAREAGVSGMLIVRCKIFADGTLQGCQILKPLTFISESAVRVLHSSRVGPATIQGKPIAVNYVFNFRFSLQK